MPNKHNAHDAKFKVKYSDTNRSYDDNGFLRVKDCVLTAEEVSDYLGREIGGWREIGLKPDEIYGIYRPLEEIEKAVTTYNNLPLTDNHINITPQNPHRERYFGTSGSHSRVQDKQLVNDIIVWVGKGIDEIEQATKDPTRGRKDLSCGYTYDLVQESGEFDGKPYQFKMINIQANHVALVKEARVSGAGIADNRTTKGKISMPFNLKLVKALKGLFASDGKAKDSDKEHLREVAKGVVSMARDADYEGKEDKLLDEIASVLSELRGVQNAEKASTGDNEPDEEAKKKAADEEAEAKKKAADEEAEAKKKEQEAKDNEAKEKEKTEAADAAVKQYAEVVALGSKILGRINPDMLSDGKPETIVNKILTAKNIAIDGKSFADKIAALKVLETQAQVRRASVNATDSNKTTTSTSLPSGKMYNPFTRKE